MRPRLVFIVVPAVASCAFACADIFGFKELTGPDGSSQDGNVPDTGTDVVVGCQHVRWPDMPDANDPGTVNQFSFAIQHLYFTTTPDGGASRAGYDLDDTCTVGPDSSSCIPPSGVGVLTDNAGGVDDESVSLLSTLISVQQGNVAGSLSDTSLNAAIADGGFTMLMTLFGYQGGADQFGNGLTFAFQASPGSVNKPPSFDGGDTWQVATADVLGGDAGTNFPALIIPNAYVTNHVLVVTYNKPITIHMIVPGGSAVSGPLSVVLNQPVLTATLVGRGDGRYDLANGVLAGRWATSDALQTIASLDTNGQPLCQYDLGLAFQLVGSAVCGARDINSTGTDNDTQPCDSVSVGVAFDAVAANIANSPTDFPPPNATCADAGVCPN